MATSLNASPATAWSWLRCRGVAQSLRFNDQEETRRQEAVTWPHNESRTQLISAALLFCHFDTLRKTERRAKKSSSPSSKRHGKPWPRPAVLKTTFLARTATFCARSKSVTRNGLILSLALALTLTLTLSLSLCHQLCRLFPCVSSCTGEDVGASTNRGGQTRRAKAVNQCAAAEACSKQESWTAFRKTLTSLIVSLARSRTIALYSDLTFITWLWDVTALGASPVMGEFHARRF